MDSFDQIALLLLLAIPLAGAILLMFSPGGRGGWASKEVWRFSVLVAAVSLVAVPGDIRPLRLRPGGIPVHPDFRVAGRSPKHRLFVGHRRHHRSPGVAQRHSAPGRACSYPRPSATAPGTSLCFSWPWAPGCSASSPCGTSSSCSSSTSLQSCPCTC